MNKIKLSPQLVEAIKELIRTAILAAIPVTIDGLVAGELSLRLILVASFVAMLRALDKLLHESGSKILELRQLDVLK